MVRILFVCMGNICRSPAAEGVFRHMAEARGLLGRLSIDSAGTIGYHEGELADARMRQAAAKRGYRLESRARRVRPADLAEFDLVLAMDRDNLFDLNSLDRDHRHGEKIRLFLEFHPEPPAGRDVPDPYYGGAEGFEIVLDLVEKASAGLLDHIEREMLA